MTDPATNSAECSLSAQDRAELDALNAKIQAILPALYQGCFESVQPVSMGSAELKFGADGRVAWNEVWTSFCHLALAGGPPHRGSWLEAASAAEVAAAPEQYQEVVEEIGRGIWLVTGLGVLPRIAPGWVGVVCRDQRMVSWLVRAIVMENVSARQDEQTLLLPAGPHFRLAKEIKNVVTALAKTHHYWTYHMPDRQRSALAATGSTLLAPGLPERIRAMPDQYEAVTNALAQGIEQATGLRPVPSQYLGWVGVCCPDVESAVWLTRAIAVADILVRREEEVIFLPANPGFEVAQQVRQIVEAVARCWRLWNLRDGRTLLGKTTGATEQGS